VFEKGPSFELQQGFGPPPHTFRFSGCQYNCGDQWDKAYMKVLTAIR